MVDDAVIARTHACAVHCLVRKVTNPKAHETNDDIVRAKRAGGKICKTDAVAGRGLARDGAIGTVNRTGAFQLDETGNAKYNRAWPGRFYSAETLNPNSGRPLFIPRITQAASFMD